MFKKTNQAFSLTRQLYVKSKYDKELASLDVQEEVSREWLAAGNSVLGLCRLRT